MKLKIRETGECHEVCVIDCSDNSDILATMELTLHEGDEISMKEFRSFIDFLRSEISDYMSDAETDFLKSRWHFQVQDGDALTLRLDVDGVDIDEISDYDYSDGNKEYLTCHRFDDDGLEVFIENGVLIEDTDAKVVKYRDTPTNRAVAIADIFRTLAECHDDCDSEDDESITFSLPDFYRRSVDFAFSADYINLVFAAAASGNWGELAAAWQNIYDSSWE